MAEVKIRVSDFNDTKVISDITKFLEVVANAVMQAISAGNIVYAEIPVKCGKCGRDAIEYQLTITMHFKWLFFSLKRDIIVKIFYDPACGLSYCRFETK